MIEQLKGWDTLLFILLNSFHTNWLDPIMLLITKTEFWTPLYIVMIYLIFRTYKKEGWKILLGIAVTVTLTDRITAGFMKPFFHRLRPSHEPSLQGVVHLVDGYTSELYGFASGHAANTMGVAMFCYLLLKDRYRWIGFIFVWPAVMMYTRIYLGVHYPGDIITGAIIGTVVGYVVFIFTQRFIKKTGTLPV